MADEGLADLQAMRERPVDYVFKIVVVGDSGVGKTQIISRFMNDKFALDSQSTIGVEFQARTICLNKKLIRAQVWDTAGQERYRAITNAYYRGALGAMLVYDITKRQSFDHVADWVKELHAHADKSIVVVLIGNKSDLKDQREVSTEDAQEFSEDQGLFFSETSALSGDNIETVFLMMVEEIYELISKKTLQKNSEGKDKECEGEDGKILMLRGTEVRVLQEGSETEMRAFKNPPSCSCFS